jgi:hypothetical protein
MLKRFFFVLTSLLLFTPFVVQAQIVAQAHNPLQALFGNGAGLEERLLYKKPVGPYTITIDGTRLIGDNYFKLEILENGKPIPAASVVIVDITPPEGMGSKSEFTAKHDGERFVINPLPLIANGTWANTGSWLVEVNVKTPTGEAVTDFGVQVYPMKPSSSFVFKAVNVAIPVVVVLAFIAVFALGRVRLERSAV